MKVPVLCLSNQANIIDADRCLGEVRYMVLQHGFEVLQLVCLQFTAQRQMKPKFIHHVRIAPFCQQYLLRWGQAGTTTAHKLGIAQWCAQGVQFPDEAW